MPRKAPLGAQRSSQPLALPRRRLRLTPELEKPRPLIRNLSNLPRPEVPARGRQKKGHVGNARVRHREIRGLAGNPPPGAEDAGPQDQPEIPFLPFLLKPAPADMATIGRERPAPKAAPGPARLLPGDDTRRNLGIPRKGQKRHALGRPVGRHMRHDLDGVHLGQPGKGDVPRQDRFLRCASPALMQRRAPAACGGPGDGMMRAPESRSSAGPPCPPRSSRSRRLPARRGR